MKKHNKPFLENVLHAVYGGLDDIFNSDACCTANFKTKPKILWQIF